jgi:putative transposase
MEVYIMVRKKRTPEEIERRAKIRELLQVSNVSGMADIQNLFKETIAEFMENCRLYNDEWQKEKIK